MTTVRKYISSPLFNRERERERERERGGERIAAVKLLIKHSKTSYAMYITMNSARIPRESKIHCYSNITDDSSYQTQTLISTQSRKIIP